MAKIRIGLGSEFNLNNGNLGLGVTNPQVRLDVDGTVKSKDFEVTGVTSFTAYEGFLRSDHQIDGDLTLNTGQGLNASLSGEIIVKDGVTVTVGAVGLGTTEVGIGTDNSVGIGTTTNQKGTTTIDSNAVNLAGGSQIECLKVYNTFTPPSGGTDERPYAPKPGELYYNYDFKTIEFHDGYGWRQVDNTTRSGRGVFPPGITPDSSQVIDYVTISSLGNALNFGNLGQDRRNCAACSSSIRGLIAGGYQTPDNSAVNEIEYITLASEGNAVDFGTLTTTKNGFAAAASSTRGLFADNTGPLGQIERVEIGTLGNAIDFGDLTFDRAEQGALSSPTRMVIGGGGAPSGTAPSNIMDFIIISSGGQALDFGDMVDRHGQLGAGFGNSTRGFFAGGLRNPVNLKIIQYITIASEGNAIFFGDLEIGRSEQAGAASNSTRGIVAGGNPTTNSIEYITISTASDAIDFGDLTVPKQRLGGGQMSDSHGGLGGF